MKVIFEEIKISTKEQELINITDKIFDFVSRSKINDGLCLIFSLHAITAIIINENESGSLHDILTQIENFFPSGINWLHNLIDDNAHAHLSSTFLGCSKTIPLKEGRLVLGNWQNIFLLEMDGPRTRTVILETMGN